MAGNMMLKYFILCFISIGLIVSNSVYDYGDFDLTLTRYELCKSPKRKNCVEVSSKRIDNVRIKFDILVKENMTSIKAKIIGTLNKKDMVKLQIKNVCEHVFFRPVLEAMFNSTGRCGVYKGHFVQTLNLETMAQNLYGGKFMYGNWTFKSLFYNDYCNMHCDKLQMMITPKKSLVIHH